MRHGFIDQSLLARHPDDRREPGRAGLTPRFEPFYATAARSGTWPLGPGFRREGAADGGPIPHAR